MFACAQGQKGGKSIHEADYQILLKQYGDAWAAEDKELDKRLAKLEDKHGKRPRRGTLAWI